MLRPDSSRAIAGKDVYILSGCSGSGKSRETEVIKGQHAHLDGIGPSDMVVCSADHFFMKDADWDRRGNPSGGRYVFDHTKLGAAHAYCMKRFVDSVTFGTSLIIVDNTNTTVEEMAPYYAVAKAYDYMVHIYTATTDPIVAHARNQHNVPLHVVQAQAARIQARRLPGHWAADIVWF